ncbi:MAG: isoprenylcysteine carboxylmethyltransferase family protein [Deltaproteobacteria bacterium]|nr:MAG: isoprenylcysteine carboxylmethyltransferase family protein [Deltaproteobacteria bacterium]
MVASALPLIAVLVFYGLGFGWRTWVQLRRYGSSGIVLFRSGRPGQHLREALFVVLAVALLAEAALAAVAPRRLPGLVPLAPATAAVLRATGTVMVLGATALMLAAQLDLGASWRVGIDEGARPGLVTGGLYRYSRNPIYVAMLTALLGFALLLPSWISLGLLIGAGLGIRRHVRDEEAYLARTYGEEYRRYAARVGRFVPGVGRLRAPGR